MFSQNFSDVYMAFLAYSGILFGPENLIFRFPLKSVIRLVAKNEKIDGPGGPLRIIRVHQNAQR